MPEIPETAELETLIRALIRKADVCLQQQIDDVRRHAEGAQSHDQDCVGGRIIAHGVCQLSPFNAHDRQHLGSSTKVEVLVPVSGDQRDQGREHRLV